LSGSEASGNWWRVSKTGEGIEGTSGQHLNTRRRAESQKNLLI
jgi:hypothetical protein